MCGRFTLKTPGSRLAEAFGGVVFPDFAPRYNIAPTQPVLCIRGVDGGMPGREVVPLIWGLIPSWAKDSSSGAKMINARSETASEKPAFRRAFQSQRCLIPADGFYEWQKLSERRRQPWYIFSPDQTPFAFAGLWEWWTDPKTRKVIESCTILTTTANSDLRELHERMPVIVPFEAHGMWLSPAASAGQLQGLLRPLPDGVLTRHCVSSAVNKVANDDQSCLIETFLPPAAPVQRTLFD